MLKIINLKCLRNICLPNHALAIQKLYNSSCSTNPNQQIEGLIERSFGQPTALTHPHLINELELVPGLTVDEFISRRQRLIHGIEKYAKDHMQNTSGKSHLIVIPSATKKYISDKIPYVFRQNSDFYYLTGCLEMDSVLTILLDEHKCCKSTLFLRPKNKHDELWDGARTGPEAALELFGVEEAYDIKDFSKIMQSYENLKPLVWFDEKTAELPSITNEIHKLSLPVNSVTEFVHSMRLFKSPAEQQLMRKTCQIASEAINSVMRNAKAGQSEHHLFAMVDYKCRMLNASHLAYPPVVAAGNNATTIHYINNTQLIKEGDLILMDAGCEYGGYTSDITRTWPITGSFTEPQKILYDIVYQVQSDLLAAILKEGGFTLDDLFDSMCIKLGKYLQEAGLVSKSITDIPGLAKAGFKFCPHHVSHYLGMDVHDTPTMPRSLRLLPGMVFTIEPGVYIGNDRTDVPAEFRGLGVRIEDDILITNDSKIEVLTESCIKQRTQLENFH